MLLRDAIPSDEDWSQTSSDSEPQSDVKPEYLVPGSGLMSEKNFGDQEPSGNDNSTFYLGKDSYTNCSKESHRLFINRQSICSRRKNKKKKENDSLGIWSHFFDDSTIEVIIKYTNQYIKVILKIYYLPENAGSLRWFML